MKCYLFADVVVHDPERFAEYLEKVPPIVAAYEGNYIVRGGKIHALEGDIGITRSVIIEFPSHQAARAFYGSEEYAPMLELRSQTTKSKVLLIDALGADYVMGKDGDVNSAIHKSKSAEQD